MGRPESRAIEFMKSNGFIDRKTAWEQVGIANLTAVISRLRQEGEPIGDRWISKPNQFGEKARHKEYFIREKK